MIDSTTINIITHFTTYADASFFSFYGTAEDIICAIVSYLRANGRIEHFIFIATALGIPANVIWRAVHRDCKQRVKKRGNSVELVEK